MDKLFNAEFDRLSIFDGNAALINEKSLNRLNRELKGNEQKLKILIFFIFT